MRKTVAPAMFIVGFILFSAWNCYAESGIAPIGGEYFIVGTSSCIEVKARQNFIDDIEPTPPPDFMIPDTGVEFGATLRIGHYQGHLFLNGDGTGTWEYYFAENSPEFTTPGGHPFRALQTVEGCNVEYEFTNRPVMKVLDGCLLVVRAGHQSGDGNNYFWETGEMSLTFDSSISGGILLLSKTRPTAEIIRNLQTTGVTNRICSRTLTAVRVGARR